MEKLITVFTPTYNRAYTLHKCYESLKEQKFEKFEWLIYDDGSSDNTKQIVDEFKNENIIQIKYHYGKNSGKHVAINRGTELANGELFFIVDSDDYLMKNSLQIIWDNWEGISKEDKKNFVGVAGRRYLLNRNNKAFSFTSNYYDADAIQFNLIDNNIQDKAEVYVTDILKKYKFTEFDNEKFMTEAVIWYKLAEDGYKIRWFNEDIYVCEYLEDGLSRNFYKNRIESIKSTCDSYNKLSAYNLPIKYKIRYKANYFRYGLTHYSLKELKNNMKIKKFKYIAIVIGILMNFKDKYKGR